MITPATTARKHGNASASDRRVDVAVRAEKGIAVAWASADSGDTARTPDSNGPIAKLLNAPILSRRGFTLIELLIVMSIVVLLATMGMTQYRTSVIRSREAVLKEDLFRMNDAIDQYYADKGQYPGTLDALVTEGYIRRIPVDPFTNAADSWQAVPSESDPNNPTATPGVYAVKSGSDQTALDGTKYSDW